MTAQYERYNEITFESYCKVSIDRAILKGRMEKSNRAGWELSLSDLTDALLFTLCANDNPVEEAVQRAMQRPTVFQVRDVRIIVHDPELGQALSFVPPQKRDVLLLSYFLNMSDPEIARKLGVSKSAVQRRRVSAVETLRRFYRGGAQ
ncbi:sigma factor-like helix-turn-helix DNA-binding protein [Intestinibacillus massiliensis]|uniref:sigma factor-like helix-turn-helix DNA-binding protein n=1 Tax=Intestinibacillus massiliensis TaxID=1871029 RepID=UPI000B361E79|nr:sigma factor-like helix-turn-helix DNA-binding protein [Intestinibacillus massiliensis]